MMTNKDFEKKQFLFVLANEGEKISFSNDNLLVKNKDGKVKIQCTCYRLFVVFIVGNCSLTTVVLQRAKKFGIRIALLTNSYRLYSVIGAEKDGNFLLKRKQYSYDSIDIARWLISNKIDNQILVLKKIRHKTDFIKDAITLMKQYKTDLISCVTINSLMAYEGLASKLYFQVHFASCNWKGRQPRLKRDIVNSVLDIGYTILFSLIEALLSAFGFDLYCGVLHTQFYMRKSLVCDLVEPFRCLIDISVKNAYNLGRIKEDDFIIINNQYQLKWEESGKYIQFLIKPLIDNKNEIYNYIQSYYRCFMKESELDKYPVFYVGGANDNNKL